MLLSSPHLTTRGGEGSTHPSILHTSPHVVKAKLIGIKTSSINLLDAAGTQGILRLGKGAALLNPSATLGKRSDLGAVLGLVDGLDAVCVVERELGIEGHLGQDVDAPVDDAHRVEIQGYGAAVDSTAGDLLVLAREEVGESRSVVASVGLAPDAELVILWLVLGESLRLVAPLVRCTIRCRTTPRRFSAS